MDQQGYLRQYEATLAKIKEVAASGLLADYDVPDEWAVDTYAWLNDNKPWEVEDKLGRPKSPSEESLRAAFAELGYDKEVDATVCKYCTKFIPRDREDASEFCSDECKEEWDASQ